ncbi:paralemmin 1a isoform X1 [Neolamprologus brichardi]|uniref:paralemmin 1a isoform X1 n=1 Tax=Neolamprologus brichardi TaxID=32507 RepID=UPI0016437A48|nr:paralemmin 1a isoform X1 [Neolamprologus brichardi]
MHAQSSRCLTLLRTDLPSDMEEVSEVLYQQDRLQLIVEKRKWQTEIENKKRQLEDDRRALQHLKSKALRDRWLLEGASAGPEQNEVRRQLEQDEARTRSLEETIDRLQQELVGLETGSVCQTITNIKVSSRPASAVEVKDRERHHQDMTPLATQVIQAPAEVKVNKSPRLNKPREATEEMKKAMYSVEIKVERDRVTGETRVLSSNTKLPVDLSDQGVKVYEDEQKVVHELNGEDVHLLSSSEVEELIHKADEASMMSQTVTTVTSLPTAEVREELGLMRSKSPLPQVPVEITGLEAKVGGEPSVAEASTENPVTMVFMGYQSVEDEDETKKVLGLQGTVKAELVHIDDPNGKTSGGEKEADPPLPTSKTPPTSTKPPMAIPVASNGETAGKEKEKKPCKCCSIM